MISDQVDILRDLTVHTCSGAVTGEDLLCAVKALYDDGPTLKHLWDMTNAEVSSVDGPKLRQIADFAKSSAPSGVGGRTAIVAPSNLAFGLGRMYEAFARSAGIKTEVRVFRSLGEGRDWLES